MRLTTEEVAAANLSATEETVRDLAAVETIAEVAAAEVTTAEVAAEINADGWFQKQFACLYSMYEHCQQDPWSNRANESTKNERMGTKNRPIAPLP